jgi:hypothetical protein
MCEDISKIGKILTLDISYLKLGFLIFLNIITAFTVNLFLIWFPKLKLYLVYSRSPIGIARYVGIFANGKE